MIGAGKLALVRVVALALFLAGCQADANKENLILSARPAVELRAIQSRAFDTNDRAKILRAVIATLQDLGYTLEKVEPAAGTVTATKLSQLRMTATVFPRGETQMVVRSNAQVRLVAASRDQNQVDAPEFYQKLFFEPLSKALFLTALLIEEADESSRSVQAKD